MLCLMYDPVRRALFSCWADWSCVFFAVSATFGLVSLPSLALSEAKATDAAAKLIIRANINDVVFITITGVYLHYQSAPSGLIFQVLFRIGTVWQTRGPRTEGSPEGR